MHEALFILLRLRCRAGLRRMVRGIRTRRGAIAFACVIVFLTLCIGPSLVFGVRSEVAAHQQTVRLAMSLILLTFCVMTVATSAGEKAVAFSLSEVNFLFAGPFTRRDLLAYKLIRGVAVTGVMAGWCLIFVLQHVAWWISCYLGLWLALMFVQLVSMSVVLVRQIIDEHVYSRARKVVLVGVVALIAVVVVPTVTGSLDGGAVVMVKRFAASWLGTCLLAPFDVFGRVFTADVLFPDLLAWGGLAVLINAALVGVVMRLDADYLEASLAISQKTYERIQRAKRVGAVGNLSASGQVRWHLPQLPWLGGVGPIVWRQFVRATRTFRGVVLFGLITLGTCALAVSGRLESSHHAGMVIGAMVYILLFADRMLSFDFRGDVDLMELLKALPLRPTAIAIGELVTPVLIVTLFHVVILCFCAFFIEAGRTLLLVAAVYAAPFNVLFFAVVNLIFLMFPVRMVASPGDFQHMGRQLLTTFALVMVMTVCCAVAAGAGGLAYLAAGQSPPAMIVVSWTVLAMIAAAMVPRVARAYVRFDPSTDAPP